jgi:hypothetical protein
MLADILGIAGALLLAIGAGMVYLPAGVIVAGVLCIAAASRAAR